MKTTNVGQYLFNSVIPKKYRDEKRNFHDTKMLKTLLAQMARELPHDEYATVLKDIFKLGADITYFEGSSFSLDDLKVPPRTKAARKKVYDHVQTILAGPGTKKEKDDKVIKYVQESINPLQEIMMQETDQLDSGLAKQVRSGSRGKPGDLQSLILGDMLMEDAKGNAIPIPLLHGYSQGVDPAEYFSNSFGTRIGVLSTKKSVAEAGYLCLGKGTLVRMADGSSKAIQDILVGDQVVGADTHGNTFPTKVTATFDNGARVISDYVFRRGRSRRETLEISATAEHKVLGRLARGTKYSTLGEVRPLDHTSMRGFNLVSHQPFLDQNAGFVEEPMAWIIGQIIGDGSTRGSTLTWSSDDQEYIDRMAVEVQKFGCLLKKVTNHAFEYSVIANPETRHVTTGATGRSYQNPIRQRLDELGLMDKLAYQKTIPREVYQWTNKSVFALIEGIIESDGCITLAKTPTSVQPIVSISMTAGDVINKVRDLLGWRLGIWSTIRITEPSKVLSKNSISTLGHHAIHTVTIAYHQSVLQVKENILINPGRKTENLKNLLNEYRPKQGLGKPSLKFIRQQNTRQSQTYDIEVANKDHLFVLANGAIVSNSKRIKQVSHRQVVTEKDCGTKRSIEVDTADPDNVGALLAHDVEGYEAGTPISTTMLKKLKSKTLSIRSPITCDAKEGLCAHCAGIREHGTLPDIGENLGIVAGQSVGESSTQAALCLHEGTLVRMADFSTRKISEVMVGDLVLGADKAGDTFPIKVLNVFNNGVRDCSEYTFKDNGSRKNQLSVLCTPDHKFLTNIQDTSKASDNLVTLEPMSAAKPTKVYRALSQGKFNDSEAGLIREDRAQLLGLLLGDGYARESGNGVFLICADDLQTKEAKAYVSSIGLSLNNTPIPIQFRVSDLATATSGDRSETTGRFVGGKDKNRAKIWLKELGIWDLYCHEKFIPDVVRTWDNHSVAELVAGMIATNGSIFMGTPGNVTITYCSTSERMIDGLDEILRHRFGIVGHKTCRTPKNGKHDAHQLAFTSPLAIDLLYKYIQPFILGCKRDRFTEMLGASKRVTGEGSQSVAYLRACRLVATKPLGQLQTYDIEVDHPDHLFVLANGLISKNSAKHSAGRATGIAKDKFVSGYELIEQLMAVPKHYPDAATVATKDGVIDAIEEAPQGGFNVRIDGEKLHVPQKMTVTVKVGDHVEAGDMLSDGLPDPSKLVKYRGIGEARRLFTKQLRDATGANRRNTEIVAKAYIDYVKVTDPDLLPNASPDDIIKYSELAKTWKPRKGYTVLNPTSAVGKYLETPVSQYTIGTRISRRVANDLEKKGFEAIDVHSDVPPFEAITVPSSRALTNASDWQERMGGYYLRQSLMEAASGGMKSEVNSTSFIPGILKGTGFGEELRETGKY